MIKVLKADWRYVELDAELESLERFREFLEPQISHLTRQETKREAAFLAKLPAEIRAEYGEMADREVFYLTDHLIPRFFRGSFVVAAWATYENVIGVLAEKVASERKLPLTPADLTGSVLHRISKFFNCVVEVPFDPDADRIKRLRDVYFVRNLLAHRNGLLHWLPDGKRNELAVIEARTRGLSVDSRDCLQLSMAYVHSVTTDVVESAQQLINRVRGGPSIVLAEGA